MEERKNQPLGKIAVTKIGKVIDVKRHINCILIISFFNFSLLVQLPKNGTVASKTFFTAATSLKKIV